MECYLGRFGGVLLFLEHYWGYLDFRTTTNTIQDIAGFHIKIQADKFEKALHTLVLRLHYLVAFDDWVKGFSDPGLLLLLRLF